MRPAQNHPPENDPEPNHQYHVKACGVGGIDEIAEIFTGAEAACRRVEAGRLVLSCRRTGVRSPAAVRRWVKPIHFA